MRHLAPALTAAATAPAAFLFVALSDVRVDVSSSPPGVVERLPSSEAGPAVLGATLVVSLATSSGQRFQVPIDIAVACVPDDFPRYPGAEILGTTSLSPCTTTWRLRYDPSHIVQTYRPLLDRGDWRVTGVRGSQIDFARRSRPAVRGTVAVVAHDQGETIEVSLPQ